MLDETNGVFSREALVEATHDSRRHGLLLLLLLVVAVVFFGFGILVGRWTQPRATPPPVPQSTQQIGNQ